MFFVYITCRIEIKFYLLTYLLSHKRHPKTCKLYIFVHLMAIIIGPCEHKLTELDVDLQKVSQYG
jgi:hypothetical protein